jgi:hypothetical protein
VASERTRTITRASVAVRIPTRKRACPCRATTLDGVSTLDTRGAGGAGAATGVVPPVVVGAGAASATPGRSAARTVNAGTFHGDAIAAEG